MALPAPADIGHGGYGMGGNYNWGMGLGGFGGLLGGMFGDSGAPYRAAGDEYKKYADQAAQYQMPFYNAGVGAIPQYQQWLGGMQNPAGYVNSLMGQYQESPYAKYLQQQAQRSGINAASAGGLVGSTPLAQQMAQISAGIASGDMQNWMNNVFGINSMYGQGLQNEMGMGQNSANQLTNTYNQLGQNMAQAAYGQAAGGQNDFWNTLGGGLSILGGFLL